MWQQEKRWDEITATVGDNDGSFVLEYGAKTRVRGTGGSSEGGEVKSLLFRDLRRRGYASPGTVLGRSMLETQDERTLEGTMSVVEVTTGLLYPSNRSDSRGERAD